MILALAFALAASQTKAPILQPGVRPKFAQAVRAVETALQNGMFDQAAKLAAELPNQNITIGWNPSGLPEAERQDFSDAVDAAVASWSQIKALKIQVAAKGDIDVSFVDLLPKGTSGSPAATDLKSGEPPRIKLIIALKFGSPPERIMAGDVYAQVGRAIGAYLGLADNPLPIGIMFPDDKPGSKRSKPSYLELRTAALNVVAVESLRSDIERKVTLQPETPIAGFSPASVNLGPVKQGTKVPITFKLVNKGSGDLIYDLRPSCGCFTSIPAGVLKAGQSTDLETTVDTTEYVGTVSRSLVLYSNDATTPALEVPVSFHAVPAFRFYRPDGPTVLVGEKPVDATILLTLPKGSALNPEQFQLEGISSATVSMKPWQGVAPDLDMNEGPKPRSGYRFTVHIPAKLQLGVQGVTLTVRTDDPNFSTLRYTLYAQRGIVSSPESLYFGDMVTARRQSLLVSRPGRPFKITKIDTGTRHIVATVIPLAGSTKYRVDVQYDGQAEQGDFRDTVHIYTDDPTQPVVEVLLTGTVR